MPAKFDAQAILAELEQHLTGDGRSLAKVVVQRVLARDSLFWERSARDDANSFVRRSSHASLFI